MKIIQAQHIETEQNLEATSNILANVYERREGKGEAEAIVITAKELEQVNRTVELATEFLKSVKDMSADRIHSSMALETLIFKQLDDMEKPYPYATSTWSKENLKALDDFTASSIKRILVKYFTSKGLTYEGWN